MKSLLFDRVFYFAVVVISFFMGHAASGLVFDIVYERSRIESVKPNVISVPLQDIEEETYDAYVEMLVENNADYLNQKLIGNNVQGAE